MIWLPVESNSDIITTYAHKLGLKEELQFIDLYTFDLNSAIEFGVPIDQCKAMILLFPLSSEELISNESNEENDSLIFIKQTIENSCGLMALLHILLNNPNQLLSPTTTPEFIKTLCSSFNSSNDSDSNEASASLRRAKFVEECQDLAKLHEEMALIGETDVPTSDEIANVPFHFVALIPEESLKVWLMDGRSNGPISFNKLAAVTVKEQEEIGIISKSRNFFIEACRVAKEEFLEKSNDQTNFAALILI